MDALMNIGPSKQAIEMVRDAIISIMQQNCDQQTIQIALQVFERASSVNNTTVSHCTFMGEGSAPAAGSRSADG